MGIIMISVYGHA